MLGSSLFVVCLGLLPRLGRDVRNGWWGRFQLYQDGASPGSVHLGRPEALGWRELSVLMTGPGPVLFVLSGLGELCTCALL